MKKIISLVLSLLMVFSMFSNMDITVTAAFEAPEGKLLTTLKEYDVAPGITEQHIVICNEDGSNQVKAYAATMDFNSDTIGALAGYNNYDSSGTWGMQTVRDQVAAAESKTGKNIVVAMNADYFNMTTGEPLGALVMNGTVVHAADTEPYYFAILKDGTPVIREGTVPLDDVMEAIGSPFLLVQDGKPVVGQDDILMPRTAIGITSDNKVVIYESDGRQAPMSCGQNIYDVAQMMIQLGCVVATYLDGGGSATYASKTEGEELMTVKNSPSDGTERKVSSSIMFYSTAEADGIFHHAVLSPYNEVYTPNSSVEFTAAGVDSSGGKVSLPENVVFALADDSFGTIDPETGVFTSTGKTGKVTINLKSGENVVGSTYIEIQHPDSISFVNEEMALGFEEETTLGLTVKYQNRSVNYKDGDFTWKIENDEEYADKWTQDDVDAGNCDASLLGTYKIVMGSFTGNTFKTSDGNTVKGDAVCSYTYNNGTEDITVSGSIHLIVGLQPTVVMDFEDQTLDDGSVVPAEDYWTFNRVVFNTSGGQILKTWDLDGNVLEGGPQTNLVYGHYSQSIDNPDDSRGGEESAEIVDIASDEPVRMGNYSLKLNFDFSNANGTEGACVGFSSQDMLIPGMPTAIGMYVYVPEGTPNLWLRLRLKDGGDNGSTQTINFTTEPEGINWTGWKYVEADLTAFQGPYRLLAGETIRLMCLPSKYNGGTYCDQNGNAIPLSQCKGSIYIDNLQFVYGTNTDDVDNPNVDTISANGIELKENTIIESNNVNFEMIVSDVENKYTSGVDYSTANVYVDGVNVTKDGSFAFDESKNALYLYNQYFANGTHTIKVLIRDKFGNQTTKTTTFTVNGNEQDTPDISFKIDGKTYLGKDTEINLMTSNLELVKELTATVKLGKDFTYRGITCNDSFEEIVDPVYNEKDNTITFSLGRKADATSEGKGNIATISAYIPETSTEGESFTYNVTMGQATVLVPKTAEGTSETTYSERKVTFATNEQKAIESKYRVETDIMVEGFDTNLYVYDNDTNNLVGNMPVYHENGTLIGTTNAEGYLTTDEFRNVQSVSVYTMDNEGYRSFILKTQCYPVGASADGSPTFVSLNAVADSDTMKSVTWISNPAKANKKAYVQYATKADYNIKGEEAFQKVEGNCNYLTFYASSIVTDNKAVLSNTVNLTGLTPDTEYVYCTGDGNNWSEIYSFRTTYDGEETNFFIIGDTQAESAEGISMIDTIINTIEKTGVDYSFGVQTGDFVESAAIYNDWNNILTAFDKSFIKSTDMIHTIGNHETYGDNDASITTSLFDIKSNEHYSVTYGNVYIAVLGYTSSEEKAKEYAEWLVEDAANSDSQWKIVVSHQPYYGTNATTTDYQYFTQYLTKAIDEAGIDFTFSGHDHSYTRTYPIKNGEQDENGTVYFISGSTGEKSYGVTKNDKYHTFATNEYDGLYLSVNASASEFTITTYNVDSSGNATVFDTYTKTKEICKNNLHTFEYKEDKHLQCQVCGYAQSSKDYNGFAYDANTGRIMRFTNGTPNTGWVIYGDDNYYLDETGVAVVGEYTIDGKTYTFDDTGKFIKGCFVDEEITLSNGNKKTITRYYVAGGGFATKWTYIDGDYYYFKKTSDYVDNPDDGMMLTGVNNIRTAMKNTVRKFTFGDDGKLILGAWESETNADDSFKGARYYWGPEYVIGTYTIDGVEFTFDNDGFVIPRDFTKVTVTSDPYQYYTGSKINAAVVVSDGDVKLTKGTQYTVKYKDNIEPGTAKIVITGAEEYGYKGSITVNFDIRLKAPQVKSYTSAQTVKTLAWSSVVGADGYEIYKYNDSTKGWELFADTTATKYDLTGLKNGSTSQFKVRAYKNSNVTKIYGEFSEIHSTEFYVSLIPTVTSVSAESKINYVTVSWKKTEGAEAYYVYRYDSKTKTYKFKARVTSTSYNDYAVANGQTYKYIVKAAINYQGNWFTGKYDKETTVKYQSTLGNIASASATASTKSIKLNWSKVSGAKGYVIYRYNSKTKTWKKIGVTTKTTFTDTKRKAGTEYTYSIRAYVKINGNSYKTKGMRVYTCTDPVKVTKVSATSSKAKTAVLKWKKADGANGYVIYRATSKNGTYKKVATVKKGSTVKYTDKNLKSRKTYYYKVKAYKTVKSVTNYGASSSAASVKIK